MLSHGKVPSTLMFWLLGASGTSTTNITTKSYQGYLYLHISWKYYLTATQVEIHCSRGKETDSSLCTLRRNKATQCGNL